MMRQEELEMEERVDMEDETSDTEFEQVKLATHQSINHTLCGVLLELDVGYAKVALDTVQEMSVDDMGLVHGGFTFGAADFAAMAAINDPNVVLVNSECRFLSPVKVGERIIFEARALTQEGRKRQVHVVGKFEEIKVFEGHFLTVILDAHVLELKLLKEKEQQEKEE
ncbi:MAG: PaaI family thioesterase [Hydrogenimonas sp.]|nr:MAG: PaaI family thioesterase [Hydrogenimonas sp.]